LKHTFIFLLILLCGLNFSLFAQPDLSTQLAALTREFQGTIGIFAENLKTGEIISVNADTKFPSASVIKIPIMVEFFYQVAAGKINPQKKVNLTPANKWGGSGVLQYFDGATKIKLIDAVTLMIILSDNTATNLVIDALGKQHAEKIAAVNSRMQSLGLKNTFLLNKMMSWETKTDSALSIRYGVGVTTPTDMALLLKLMYQDRLVSPEISRQMLEILKKQQYDSMLPRLLPLETAVITVVHKTGSVTGVCNDVGIVFSKSADYAISVFCDESHDHRGSVENMTLIAAAKASRLVWNHFTGSHGFEIPQSGQLDWSHYPGGTWTKFQITHALFPHPARKNGLENPNDPYPFAGHYDDSSVVVIQPAGWHETEVGVNLIIHFHGHRNHVLNVLEQFNLPQQLRASRKNALLVLAQGPKDAPDSFGGNIEEPGGLQKFVDAVLQRLTQDSLISRPQINQIILSAHSGGYRPTAFALAPGRLTEKISEVYLFDAFYGQHEKYFEWIKNYSGKLISIYTEHLAGEHQTFMDQLRAAGIPFGTNLSENQRLTFYPTDVCHNCVLAGNFEKYLELSSLGNVQE